MTITHNVEIQEELDLELIDEYHRLTKVESAIKKRKKDIRKTIVDYLEDNNLKETLPINNLVGVLEERTTYKLNPFILEAALPPRVFSSIVKKDIDMTKVKKEFLDNNISVNLLRVAEVSNTKNVFSVRREDRNKERRKTIPFWREE